MTTTPLRPWYTDDAFHFDNYKLAFVAQYMIDHGDAQYVPLMLEKPWQYADEYAAAVAEAEEAS